MMDDVIKILKKEAEKLCILSTSTKLGRPEAAIMGYAVGDNLEIIFSTSNKSRKYKNLKENSLVSITFGTTFDKPNVQYDGNATLIEKGHKEFSNCEELYFSDHPESLEYKGIPETVFIKVKPAWIRLSDYSKDPIKIEEKIIIK